MAAPQRDTTSKGDPRIHADAQEARRGILSVDPNNPKTTIHYSHPIAAVKDHRPMSSRSQLRALDPFLDNHGVLRVGGRLKHAVLSPDKRHPMIVSPQSHLTRLLVTSCHRRTLHGGVQLTLSLVRLRFWIPRGRAVVKY